MSAGPEPTDPELEAYYKAHEAEFTRPERRRVLLALLPMTAVAPPSPTDAEVEAAYQERLDQFEQPERRRVAHILVRVPQTGGSAAEDGAKAKAEAALQRVKTGADFGQVAREVSEDTATGPKGGELGLISRGEMVPPFEQVAFDLKAGEIGGPVRSVFGYHVVKVLEVVPGSKKELKEVAPTLRATLVAEGQLRALRDRADEAQQALVSAPDFGAEAPAAGPDPPGDRPAGADRRGRGDRPGRRRQHRHLRARAGRGQRGDQGAGGLRDLPAARDGSLEAPAARRGAPAGRAGGPPGEGP